MKIKPLNRHLVVEKIKEEREKKELTGFVVPEEFKPKDVHTVVKVLSVAEDSKFKDDLLKGSDVIVETSMIFKVKDVHMILENYVYGIIN
tara:strand:+ start:312 stop:581 length:270 start_codon:yes stop_codon:yes gene_type:complete